jgi:hypothetical protein
MPDDMRQQCHMSDERHSWNETDWMLWKEARQQQAQHHVAPLCQPLAQHLSYCHYFLASFHACCQQTEARDQEGHWQHRPSCTH